MHTDVPLSGQKKEAKKVFSEDEGVSGSPMPAH